MNKGVRDFSSPMSVPWAMCGPSRSLCCLVRCLVMRAADGLLLPPCYPTWAEPQTNKARCAPSNACSERPEYVAAGIGKWMGKKCRRPAARDCLACWDERSSWCLGALCLQRRFKNMSGRRLLHHAAQPPASFELKRTDVHDTNGQLYFDPIIIPSVAWSLLPCS